MLVTAMVILVLSMSWSMFYLAITPPSNDPDEILILQGFVMWLVANCCTGGWLMCLSEVWGWFPTLVLGTLTTIYGAESKDRCHERQAQAAVEDLEDMLRQS